ncbi:MAG: type II toxin-antitoxin system Phd/YefM family antitoxin [Pseudonocardiaceae bacterium]
MSWQVQEAKQRFSEVLRAVEQGGPQVITRHGQEIAVIIDMAEYRRLTGPRRSLVEHLTSFPKLHTAPGELDVFAEVEAERTHDLPRDIELGTDE